MNTRRFLALMMGAAVITGACTAADNDSTLDLDDDPAPMTEPARPSADAMPPAGASQQVISGSLGKVDPDGRTFTLIAEGRDQTFRFNDATDVSGMAGSQGIAGREGANVTVYYREDGGGMTATRIVMNGSAPAPSPSAR